MKSRLVMAVVIAICITAPGTASASAAGAPLFRYSIESSPDFSDLTRTAQRNGYVVLQAWRLDEMRAIKAANPNTKVLVYKNLSFCSKTASPSGLTSTGVSCEQAELDPSWFLLNSSGQRFTSWGYHWLWAMDVGNADYQRAWADRVVAEVNRNGWDGVLLDDVNPTMKYHYKVGSVAKYPSDAAYSAATRSALAHIGPRISGAGKLAIANNAAWVEYYSTGVDWLQFLDGAMDEMWLKWSSATGEGYRGETQWTTQLNELKETERQGKIFVARTQSANTDAAAARYGYATLLLGTRGRAAFSFGDSSVETPLFPEYSLPIGDATGPEERLSSGVHRRVFTSGLVLVNPTSATRSVALGGTHSGSGLSGVSSVTMPPRTGLVLTRDGAAPASPRPAPTPGRANPKPKPPRSLLVASTAAPERGSVSLTWSRAPRAWRYEVRRSGRRIGTTRKRSFVDRDVVVGRRYRYRVVAIGRRGRRSLPSRAVRVRVRAGRLGAAIRSAHPRSWRKAQVLRLVRASGARRWRTTAQLRNPVRGASIRVKGHRPVFRVVARGKRGALSARVSVRRGA
jgi:Hypothetical glycosyl hydrolase family 15